MSESDRPLPAQVAGLLPHVPDEHRSWFLAGVRFATVGFALYGDALSRMTDDELSTGRLEEEADGHVYWLEQRRRLGLPAESNVIEGSFGRTSTAGGDWS